MTNNLEGDGQSLVYKKHPWPQWSLTRRVWEFIKSWVFPPKLSKDSIEKV